MFMPYHHSVSKRGTGVHNNKIRGVVVDNKDPDGDGKRGRIKIRCRDIHDNFPDDHLPWALPEEGFGHGGPGQGKVNIPPIGSTVFVTHQDNTLYHPQYSHGPSTDDRPVKELGADKPGQVDRGGNLSMVDHSGGKNEKIETHQSGTGHKTDTEGNVTMDMVKKAIMNVFGDEGFILNSKKKITFNCPEIEFKTEKFISIPPLEGKKHEEMDKAPSARPKPSLDNPKGKTKY